MTRFVGSFCAPCCRAPIPLASCIIDACHPSRDPAAVQLTVTSVDKELVLRAASTALRDEWVRQLRSVKRMEVKAQMGHLKRDPMAAAVNKVAGTMVRHRALAKERQEDLLRSWGPPHPY
jgi:hypothetical protein